MPIFSQALLALVLRNLGALTFLSAWHADTFVRVKDRQYTQVCLFKKSLSVRPDGTLWKSLILAPIGPVQSLPDLFWGCEPRVERVPQV